MDKNQALERTKKAVSAFFKIRHGVKIYFAFATGISTSVYSYKVLLEQTAYRPISVYYAFLAGAATTAFALLFFGDSEKNDLSAKKARA